jgi:hypothetical protein
MGRLRELHLPTGETTRTHGEVFDSSANRPGESAALGIEISPHPGAPNRLLPSPFALSKHTAPTGVLMGKKRLSPNRTTPGLPKEPALRPHQDLVGKTPPKQNSA